MQLRKCKEASIDGVAKEVSKITLVLTGQFRKILNGDNPWIRSITMLIYRCKGSWAGASIHIGITLVSYIGQLFTGITNSKFSSFLNAIRLLDQMIKSLQVF